MRNKRKVMLATAIMAVSAVIVVATPGCTHPQSETGGYADPFFPREYARIAEVAVYPQAASGARSDPTLYDIHFFGGRLNSLGEDKLTLMLDDDNNERPTLVYIDAGGSDDDFAARQESIRGYLAGKGLSPEVVSFERGRNPHSRTAAAPLLRNLPKTDSKAESEATSGN